MRMPKPQQGANTRSFFPERLTFELLFLFFVIIPVSAAFPETETGQQRYSCQKRGNAQADYFSVFINKQLMFVDRRKHT
jgi:hypothetical protein